MRNIVKLTFDFNNTKVFWGKINECFKYLPFLKYLGIESFDFSCIQDFQFTKTLKIKSLCTDFGNLHIKWNSKNKSPF